MHFAQEIAISYNSIRLPCGKDKIWKSNFTTLSLSNGCGHKNIHKKQRRRHMLQKRLNYGMTREVDLSSMNKVSILGPIILVHVVFPCIGLLDIIIMLLSNSRQGSCRKIVKVVVWFYHMNGHPYIYIFIYHFISNVQGRCILG